jgi:hypothetical protein
VGAPRFALVGFSHERAALPLKGLHQDVDCTKCHKRETGRFPAGQGTTWRLTGIGTMCSSCHTDVHEGQLGAACESCHQETARAFRIARYTHKDPKLKVTFFQGRHARAACNDCHIRPGGIQTAAVSYKVGKSCSACHGDAHDGALGRDCSACHRLS